jgi:hypothetical protein
VVRGLPKWYNAISLTADKDSDFDYDAWSTWSGVLKMPYVSDKGNILHAAYDDVFVEQIEIEMSNRDSTEMVSRIFKLGDGSDSSTRTLRQLICPEISKDASGNINGCVNLAETKLTPVGGTWEPVGQPSQNQGIFHNLATATTATQFQCTATSINPTPWSHDNKDSSKTTTTARIGHSLSSSYPCAAPDVSVGIGLAGGGDVNTGIVGKMDAADVSTFYATTIRVFGTRHSMQQSPIFSPDRTKPTRSTYEFEATEKDAVLEIKYDGGALHGGVHVDIDDIMIISVDGGSIYTQSPWSKTAMYTWGLGTNCGLSNIGREDLASSSVVSFGLENVRGSKFVMKTTSTSGENDARWWTVSVPSSSKGGHDVLRSKCRSDGGDLASVHSDEDVARASFACASSSESSCVVGLKRSSSGTSVRKVPSVLVYGWSSYDISNSRNHPRHLMKYAKNSDNSKSWTHADCSTNQYVLLDVGRSLQSISAVRIACATQRCPNTITVESGTSSQGAWTSNTVSRTISIVGETALNNNGLLVQDILMTDGSTAIPHVRYLKIIVSGCRTGQSTASVTQLSVISESTTGVWSDILGATGLTYDPNKIGRASCRERVY